MAVITNVGLNSVAESILSNVSHVAVGTNIVAESDNDVALGTETNRLAPTATKQISNQIIIRAFFANASLPPTVEELGLFMNGSGLTDSGELLLRALSSFTKGRQDLNVVIQLTVRR